MSNLLYPKGKEAFARALIDWVSDDIRAILIDVADYTYNAAHDFLDDVPVAARVATVALAGKSATNGVCDASDITFTAVTGDPCEALILYKHTGVDATARLIAYIDAATNLPTTPVGLDISVIWDNGASKIFAL